MLGTGRTVPLGRTYCQEKYPLNRNGPDLHYGNLKAHLVPFTLTQQEKSLVSALLCTTLDTCITDCCASHLFTWMSWFPPSQFLEVWSWISCSLAHKTAPSLVLCTQEVLNYFVLKIMASLDFLGLIVIKSICSKMSKNLKIKQNTSK